MGLPEDNEFLAQVPLWVAVELGDEKVTNVRHQHPRIVAPVLVRVLEESHEHERWRDVPALVGTFVDPGQVT